MSIKIRSKSVFDQKRKSCHLFCDISCYFLHRNCSLETRLVFLRMYFQAVPFFLLVIDLGVKTDHWCFFCFFNLIVFWLLIPQQAVNRISSGYCRIKPFQDLCMVRSLQLMLLGGSLYLLIFFSIFFF